MKKFFLRRVMKMKILFDETSLQMTESEKAGIFGMEMLIYQLMVCMENPLSLMKIL